MIFSFDNLDSAKQAAKEVYSVLRHAVHFVMYCARLLWSIAYFVCYSVEVKLAGSHDGFNPFRRKSQECPASVKRSFHTQLVD